MDATPVLHRPQIKPKKLFKQFPSILLKPGLGQNHLTRRGATQSSFCLRSSHSAPGRHSTQTRTHASPAVGVDSTKVKVSCRLGAYWLYLGYSTTERVLSSVCVSRGAHSLFCFLLPHPRGCRTTDNTRTKHSRYSTVCQSTKPFDCVSTLAEAVAPTF